MGVIAEMIRDDAIMANKIEIAKNLLAEGLSVSVISKTTGLDESTILSLKVKPVAA